MALFARTLGHTLLRRAVRAARRPAAAGFGAVPHDATDDDVMQLLRSKAVPVFELETVLGNHTRAVALRRRYYAEKGPSFSALPYAGVDAEELYSTVHGANCESVVGFVNVPVGIVGPLQVNGEETYVPIATTEGALVASTNRGAKAIGQSGGATAVILGNGMTRAPLVRMPSVALAGQLKHWLEQPDVFRSVEAAFNSTTSHGRLLSVTPRVAGRNVYIRFKCQCGDAMGMNMVSKGSKMAIEVIRSAWPQMDVVSISGNMCADKKPSAVNWLDGRGRSVACEAIITKDVVENMLHTTVGDLVSLNVNKNLVGSSLAGSLGGFNAHASNIVSALFLATGNDIAQNVESSTCITLMERSGEDLHISVTMPSIEAGTVGGGTTLPAQAACLEMMGCRGPADGANADKLARIVCATVMAGELSLMAALAADHLVSSHMRLNRKPAAAKAPVPAAQPQPQAATVTATTAVAMAPLGPFGRSAPDTSAFALRQRQRGAAPRINEVGAGPWQAPPAGVAGVAAAHTSARHLYGDENQGPGVAFMF